MKLLSVFAFLFFSLMMQSSIPTGVYNVVFEWEVTEAVDGARRTAEDGAATMQARIPEDEQVGSKGSETLTLELNGETNRIHLDWDGTPLESVLTPVVETDGRMLYAFAMEYTEAKHPISAPGFYEQLTEFISGSYNPASGVLQMTDILRQTLTWDRDSQSSVSTTTWLVTGAIKSQPPFGSVTLLTGNVIVERDGKQIGLQENDPVFEGDVIETRSKSFVKIVGNDGSVHTISPKSKITIEKVPNGEPSLFNLIKGKVLNEIERSSNNQGGDKFLIKTKTATLGVRGTEFEVSHELLNGLETTTVAVESGEVSVTEKETGAMTLLGGGESLTMTAPTESNYIANLSIHRKQGDSLALKWDGNGIGPVLVEKSATLIEWEPWVEIPAGDQRELMIEPISPSGGEYYRMIALQERPDVSIPTGVYNVAFDVEIIRAEGDHPADETVGLKGTEVLEIRLDNEAKTIGVVIEGEVAESKLVTETEGAGLTFEMALDQETITGTYFPRTGLIAALDEATDPGVVVWALTGLLPAYPEDNTSGLAPESILNQRLTLTIETSSSVEAGTQDVFEITDEKMVNGATYGYSRLSNEVAAIDYAVVDEGDLITGSFLLTFIEEKAGTFQNLEGDLSETGTFTLEALTNGGSGSGSGGENPVSDVSIPTGVYNVVFEFEITEAVDGAIQEGGWQARIPEDEQVGSKGSFLLTLELNAEAKRMHLNWWGTPLESVLTPVVATDGRTLYAFAMEYTEAKQPISSAPGFYVELKELISGTYDPASGALEMTAKTWDTLTLDGDSGSSVKTITARCTGAIKPPF